MCNGKISRYPSFRISQRRSALEAPIKGAVEMADDVMIDMPTKVGMNIATVVAVPILLVVMSTTATIMAEKGDITRQAVAVTDLDHPAMVEAATTITTETRTGTEAPVRTGDLTMTEERSTSLEDMERMSLTSRSSFSRTSVVNLLTGLKVPLKPRHSKPRSCFYIRGYQRTKLSNDRRLKVYRLWSIWTCEHSNWAKSQSKPLTDRQDRPMFALTNMWT
jgi:hypothetical protein